MVFNDILDKNYIQRLSDLLAFVGPRYGASDFLIDQEVDPVKVMAKMPVLDDRLIGNKTFALRAKRLLEHIQELYSADPAVEKVISGLLEDTETLLQYQIDTCTDGDEISYFKNNRLWKKD